VRSLDQAIFSFTKIYSTSFRAQEPLTQVLSAEIILRNEVGILEKQREVLVLASEELKLKHERSARQKAIGIAQSMILRSTANSSASALLSSMIPTNQTTGSPPRAAGDAAKVTPAIWCDEAAKRFGILRPVAAADNWGTMKAPAYKQAWTAHRCDATVFPHIEVVTGAPAELSAPAQPPIKAVVPTSSTPASARSVVPFGYLKTIGRPRRKVTVSERGGGLCV